MPETIALATSLIENLDNLENNQQRGYEILVLSWTIIMYFLMRHFDCDVMLHYWPRAAVVMSFNFPFVICGMYVSWFFVKHVSRNSQGLLTWQSSRSKQMRLKMASNVCWAVCGEIVRMFNSRLFKERGCWSLSLRLGWAGSDSE